MDNKPKILIVDDLEGIRSVLGLIVKGAGYKTITGDNGCSAIELVQKEAPDLVLMDIRMPEMDGLEALKRMKKINPAMPVILITAYGQIDNAVDAVKLGAYDYVTKPFDNDKLLIIIKNALSEANLKREVKTLHSKLNKKSSLQELMGPSSQIKKVIEQVNLISLTNFTVFVCGETGSGKELVASAIHDNSPRREGEFVAVDCSAIPETLIESELFGYERGAYTGAEKRKDGCFELSSSGTLFMDEISNLPMSVQKKLLRVLETHYVKRLGATKGTELDFRLIIASNENIYESVEKGEFREDLYHRLDEFTIKIPPLRERKDDIIYLCNRFLTLTNQELDKNVQGFSENALDCLFNYDWPGNVRELRNVIRRAVLLSNDIIDVCNLPVKNWRLNAVQYEHSICEPLAVEIDINNGFSLKDYIKKLKNKLEKQVIEQVLSSTGGNKNKASKILKIDYTTLHHKIKQYGLGTKNDDY